MFSLMGPSRWCIQQPVRYSVSADPTQRNFNGQALKLNNSDVAGECITTFLTDTDMLQPSTVVARDVNIH